MKYIPTDRAQRAHEKNGVIFLDIMLTPEVKVIKMSKMAHFLYFLLMAAEIQSHFLVKCILERSYLASLEHAMNY